MRSVLMSEVSGIIEPIISGVFAIGGIIIGIAVLFACIYTVRDFVLRSSDAKYLRRYKREERILRALEREQYRLNRSVESYKRRISGNECI
jgi:protein-S-isoprenylcysteine O-methyltransferase Ste14